MGLEPEFPVRIMLVTSDAQIHGIHSACLVDWRHGDVGIVSGASASVRMLACPNRRKQANRPEWLRKRTGSESVASGRPRTALHIVDGRVRPLVPIAPSASQREVVLLAAALRMRDDVVDLDGEIARQQPPGLQNVDEGRSRNRVASW